MFTPVLVHRWFRGGGEGWAYHPDLDPVWRETRDALRGLAGGDPGPVGPVEVAGRGLTLVGVRTDDTEVRQDRQGRRLVLLRVAVLSAPPTPAEADRLRELLAGLPPPALAGQDAALRLPWHAATTLPGATTGADAPVAGPAKGGVKLALGAAALVLMAAVGLAIARQTAEHAGGDGPKPEKLPAPAGGALPPPEEVTEGQLDRLTGELQALGNLEGVVSELGSARYAKYVPRRHAEICGVVLPKLVQKWVSDRDKSGNSPDVQSLAVATKSATEQANRLAALDVQHPAAKGGFEVAARPIRGYATATDVKACKLRLVEFRKHLGDRPENFEMTPQRLRDERQAIEGALTTALEQLKAAGPDGEASRYCQGELAWIDRTRNSPSWQFRVTFPDLSIIPHDNVSLEFLSRDGKSVQRKKAALMRPMGARDWVIKPEFRCGDLNWLPHECTVTIENGVGNRTFTGHWSLGAGDTVELQDKNGKGGVTVTWMNPNPPPAAPAAPAEGPVPPVPPKPKPAYRIDE